MAQATDDNTSTKEFSTIHVSERNHVSMSVTVDVSEMSDPEKKHLMDKARQHENELMELVERIENRSRKDGN